MFMGYSPPAVDLEVTNRRPHPDIGFFPFRPLSADPVEAMGEGHV